MLIVLKRKEDLQILRDNYLQKKDMIENGQKFSSGNAYKEDNTDLRSLLETANNNLMKDEKKSSSIQNNEEIPKELLDIYNRLVAEKYIPNLSILYTIKNAMLLHMPILIEGEPGVGKTSLAKAIASAFSYDFLKVQFYEGITNNDILYEYDYAKQMLYMNAIRENIKEELKGLSSNDALQKLSVNGINFFSKDFLIERPLLQSINGTKKSVLLLDEVDKTSEETEYLLLEMLSEYSITIPEYGTIKCPDDKIPLVILTSNGYRELSDALKRRCLYLYIEPKTIEESQQIIMEKAHVSEEFAQKIATKVDEIRKLDLKQKPSISDSINWTITLINTIGGNAFDDKNSLITSLGTILKNKSDIDLVKRSGIL